MFDIQLREMNSSLIHSGLDVIDSILSDDYICHHGVKGQKKGQRQYQNKDGTWTELGKERRRVGDGLRKRIGDARAKHKEKSSGDLSEKEQKKVAKAFKKGFKSADWDTTAESILKKGGSNDEPIKKIRSKLADTRKTIEDLDKEASKILDKYDKNREHYSNIAAITNALDSPEIYGTKMSNIGDTVYHLGYSDGDQGRITSVSCYMELTNNRKKAIALAEKYYICQEKYVKGCREAVDSVLGKYGNMHIARESRTKINGKSMIVGTTVGKEFADRLLRNDDWNDGLGNNSYRIHLGSDFPQNNSRLKMTLKESEGYANKLKGAETYYMREAVHNLNLGNIDIRDMSNSQWESLRKECNRLGGSSK